MTTMIFLNMQKNTFTPQEIHFWICRAMVLIRQTVLNMHNNLVHWLDGPFICIRPFSFFSMSGCKCSPSVSSKKMCFGSHGYVVTDKHIGCSCLSIICCRNAQYCGQIMQDRLAETPNIVDKRCKIGWWMLLSDWIWEWHVMPASFKFSIII